MNARFWRDRRVFLTGHTGFKGGWLAFVLRRLGASVTGYALAPDSTPNLFTAGGISEVARSHIGDIRDQRSLLDALQRSSPDVVIHMAAQALVRRSYVDPVETFSTNVMGTAYVLEAVRATPGVRSVVIVTSDKCYENKEWLWGYRETDAMGGFDPYSSSKGCAELVTAAYRRSYFHPDGYESHGVAIASARAGNVIGGGDWAKDRLVPDLIRAFHQKQPAVIRNPQAVRPWQHVLEPLRGYLRLAELLYVDGKSYADSWNFGPRDEDVVSVSAVATAIAELWGGGADLEMGSKGDPHEARLLKLDCSKAQAKLGWKPAWSLDRALKSTVEWYRAYYDSQDVRKMLEQQVDDYLESVNSNFSS